VLEPAALYLFNGMLYYPDILVLAEQAGHGSGALMADGSSPIFNLPTAVGDVKMDQS